MGGGEKTESIRERGQGGIRGRKVEEGKYKELKRGERTVEEEEKGGLTTPSKSFQHIATQSMGRLL